jgi:hypothetical protein
MLMVTSNTVCRWISYSNQKIQTAYVAASEISKTEAKSNDIRKPLYADAFKIMSFSNSVGAFTVVLKHRSHHHASPANAIFDTTESLMITLWPVHHTLKR